MWFSYRNFWVYTFLTPRFYRNFLVYTFLTPRYSGQASSLPDTSSEPYGDHNGNHLLFRYIFSYSFCLLV
ncbi:hypothetical protein Hanom_Chr14g01262761 [Helianthus anomalus]